MIDFVKRYIEKINNTLGFSIEFNYKFDDKVKFPVYINDKDIVIVPEFFQHDKLPYEYRKMMIVFLYSIEFLCSKQHPSLVSPECLAKGICDALDEKYIPMNTVEKVLREVRMSLYNDANNPDAQTKSFSETKLCDLCMHSKDYKDYKVDLRKNLIILSAPSGAGKTTVYNLLKQRMPEIRKAVTVTTRTPRAGEINGEDYYFYSKEEFENREKNGEFVEFNLYDNGYYATPFDEINKHPVTTPVFLIVDTNGMSNVMNTYPLSTSIFLSPPSIEELEKRIRERGANTEDEIDRRVAQAKGEMQRSEFYDYLTVNRDLNICVDEIAQIVEDVKTYI